MIIARSIITLIISTIRRLHKRIKWGRRSKATNTGRLTNDMTNPGVHLTYLISKMVKTTTKISTHELELIRDGNKRCLYSRRKRWSRRRKGSRSIGSILGNSNVSLLLVGESRLLMRLLGLRGQLSRSPPHREERGKRNKNVHVCENECDSWGKN